MIHYTYWWEKVHYIMRLGKTSVYVLQSLIPYTEANLKLAFSPNRFFNDLERLSKSGQSRSSMRQAYYRLANQGFIDTQKAHAPRLTAHAITALERYAPKKLPVGAALLLVFDISERERYKRNALRALLRELKFTQIQQSVWQSDYDSLRYLKLELRTLQLGDQVKVYESFLVL